MRKITSEENITRRQILRTLLAGTAGLATLAVFAKLPSVSIAGNLVEEKQHQSSKIESNEHFVMYF